MTMSMIMISRTYSFHDVLLYLQSSDITNYPPQPDAHKLKDLEMRHSDARAKMSAFFQLKLVLAPVIETLILLDRLAFLLEQVTLTANVINHLSSFPLFFFFCIP